MRVLVRSMIAVVVLQFFLSGTAFSDEHAFRSLVTKSSAELANRDAIRNWVVTLLEHERFADLERLGAKYRTAKSRTSSGIWKLSLFYAGISSAIHKRRKQICFSNRNEVVPGAACIPESSKTLGFRAKVIS